MSSFLDMAPTTARVVVVGKDKIPVPGIKAKGVAYLVKRYWSVISAAMGESKSSDDLMMQIIEMGDDVIAAIIACGCGHPGSEQAERIAFDLSLEKQIEFLTGIIEETLPAGPGPFVERVMKLMAAFKIVENQQPVAVSGPIKIKLRGKKSA